MPTLWCRTQDWAPTVWIDVVAVVVRRQPEEVEGAPRASRAPHLHADGDESEQGGDHGPDHRGGVGEQRVARRCLALQRVDQAVRSGGGVPRILDDRGEGPVGQGLARWEAHGGGDGDPVAHAHVVEPGVEMLVRVERRRRRRVGRQDRERRRGERLAGGLLEAVAGARGEVADDQATEAVDHARADRRARPVEQVEVRTGRGADGVGLPDRPVTVERQRGRRADGAGARQEGTCRNEGTAYRTREGEKPARQGSDRRSPPSGTKRPAESGSA